MGARVRERDVATLDALAGVLAVRDDADLERVLAGSRHLGSGMYNDVFAAAVPAGRYGARHDVVLRVSYLDGAEGSGTRADEDPVHVQEALGEIGTALVRSGASPHFAIALGFRACSAKLRAAFAASVARARLEGARVLPRAFARGVVSFHERFDSDLGTLMRARALTWRQVALCLFQALHAIATLQRYVPGFRHNDARCDNVLVERTRGAWDHAADAPARPGRDLPGRAYEFVAPRHSAPLRLVAPDLGVFSAIHDYDLAHAPGVAPNRVIEKRVIASLDLPRDDPAWCGRFLVNSPDPSFDAYTLLHSATQLARESPALYAKLLQGIAAFAPAVAAAPPTSRYHERRDPDLDVANACAAMFELATSGQGFPRPDATLGTFSWTDGAVERGRTAANALLDRAVRSDPAAARRAVDHLLARPGGSGRPSGRAAAAVHATGFPVRSRLARPDA